LKADREDGRSAKGILSSDPTQEHAATEQDVPRGVIAAPEGFALVAARLPIKGPLQRAGSLYARPERKTALRQAVFSSTSKGT